MEQATSEPIPEPMMELPPGFPSGMADIRAVKDPVVRYVLVFIIYFVDIVKMYYISQRAPKSENVVHFVDIRYRY